MEMSCGGINNISAAAAAAFGSKLDLHVKHLGKEEDDGGVIVVATSNGTTQNKSIVSAPLLAAHQTTTSAIPEDDDDDDQHDQLTTNIHSKIPGWFSEDCPIWPGGF